ncbi:hypothetical protein RDWZM_007508 [Blomia tropicalis]|uniref:Uncharacterized protein n=1 Tax=Blomia tropicalis TaxID=40697 RepID=A0A9Q0RJ65_BLOTA|nr:hypothetical protein RDWZM_007508 [Blomia tropicalis]
MQNNRGARGGFRGGFNGARGARNGSSSFSALQVKMPETAKFKSLQCQPHNQGKEGRAIELVSNFYKIDSSSVVTLHYDIQITPGKESSDRTSSDHPSNPSSLSDEVRNANLERFIKKFAPKIFELLTVTKSDLFKDVTYCYDGYRNFFTTKLLNFNGKQSYNAKVQVQIDNRPKDFDVKLTFVDRINMQEVTDFYNGKATEISERVISIYEILLRSIMSKDYAVFQRKFYDMSTLQNGKTDLVQFVNGFTSGVQMAEVGLCLNLHLKTSCVLHENFRKLADIAQRIGMNNLDEINRLVRHLKIFTNHGKRQLTYSIDCLIPKTPNSVFIKSKDGQSISIAEYFMKEYKLRVQNWPLVKSTGKQARLLPLDLCFLVENQFLSLTKINPQIQRELLEKSTNAPNVYFDKLDGYVKKISSIDINLQKEFGVSIDTKPIALQGRVLQEPRVMNDRAGFFRTGDAPKSWAIVCLDHNQKDNLINFKKQLISSARACGIVLPEPNPCTYVGVKSIEEIGYIFQNITNKMKISFIFVGIPSSKIAGVSSAAVYGQIKFACDQKAGVMSQCFKSEYISSTPRGYFENFFLKVNGKLGGQNAIVEAKFLQCLPFKTDRTMFIGVDVNHPAQTEKLSLSVSAAVGSMDPLFSRYVSSIRVQKKDKDEMVKQLNEMVGELLDEYLKINKFLPENLIMFRDGVSDGAFSKVLNTEVPLIQEAINKFGKKLRITVIVVQKNHNTRFALTQANESGRRPTYNVPKGTVVDSTIVNPTYKMFYLNSHFSALGTSKPSKYVILRDDLNLTADQIQKMCFMACYNSIRTRNVIAIPTMVRYADLCAYRSKLHVEAQRMLVEDFIGQDDDIAMIEEKIIEKINSVVQINQKVSNRLYYC